MATLIEMCVRRVALTTLFVSFRPSDGDTACASIQSTVSIHYSRHCHSLTTHLNLPCIIKLCFSIP